MTFYTYYHFLHMFIVSELTYEKQTLFYFSSGQFQQSGDSRLIPAVSSSRFLYFKIAFIGLSSAYDWKHSPSPSSTQCLFQKALASSSVLSHSL